MGEGSAKRSDCILVLPALDSRLSTFDFVMRCPICHTEFDPAQSTALPFCSERCRTIDLGRWLEESYGMPVDPDPEADEQPKRDPASNGESSQE